MTSSPISLIQINLYTNVSKEVDKFFDEMAITKSLSKHVLHQVHDVLGHSGTLITYKYVKCLYCWKSLMIDVDSHVK